MHAAESDRILKRVAWRLMPFLCLLYFVAYLDRVNVGFAALTMNIDLQFSAAIYGTGAGIFFVSYFLCEVPSNLLMQRYGARRWIARIMISWGIVSICMALVTGPRSFYALRFLLGVAEAGFFPGIILYLTYWFPSLWRGRILGAFLLAIPVSNLLGEPLSGLLLGMDAFGLRGWQWLFIIEGVPAVVLGFVVLRVLLDGPQQASWLQPQERDWLQTTLRAESEAAAKQHGVHWVAAFRQPELWLLAVPYFLLVVCVYGFGLWLPQIVRSQGNFTTQQTGLVCALPYCFAAVAMLWWGQRSDRLAERRWHFAIAAAIAAGGFVGAAWLPSTTGALLALCLAAVGIFAALPVYWAVPSARFAGSAAAAGIALVNSIANVGGYIGPVAMGILKERTGEYAWGLTLLAACAALAAFVAFPLLRAPEPASR